MSYYIAPMRIDDIAEVSRVEHLCFTNPWPQSAYRRELRNPGNNAYIVLWEHDDSRPSDTSDESRGALSILPFFRRSERAHDDRIVGFAGMWMLYDEAHVTTIGVTPDLRGKGLGELMLIRLFEIAGERTAEWVTLEVRVSNASAQALYHKYGFSQQGLRRRYYSDNGEDASIMWSPSIRTDEYRQRFAELRDKLHERMAGQLISPPRRDDGDDGRMESTS